MPERPAITASTETNVCIGDTLVRLLVLYDPTLAGGCRPMRDVKKGRSGEHENTDGNRSCDQLGTIDGQATLRGCAILP